MSGLTANIINLITDNLRDRYESGFPILKELIQNAEDAPASRFVFGHHPGFPDSEHALLKGPGLFFYNNGDFKESDKRAIASFAENTKASEEGVIGKFGLGMKSVFHLCEAFFYVAQNGASDILNPWNTQNNNLHPDWDKVEKADWELLKGVAGEIAVSDDKWFLLWLPLRRKDHLINDTGNPTGSIIDRFPGDKGIMGRDISFLQDISLPKKLAPLLPLLCHLKTIEYRSFSSVGFNFKLTLDAVGRLECRENQQVFVKGSVKDEQDYRLSFHGSRKDASHDQTFTNIQKHPTWPKTLSRDAAGKEIQTPDKSKPEGSVVVCHDDQSTGQLSIQWALFLPLDDESHIFKANIDGFSKYYRFIIHGQFFVEAGRRSIYAFRHLGENCQDNMASLDESELRKYWNKKLAQQIVLPMFLPALSSYVSQYKLSDNETSAVTKAICEAKAGDGTSFLSPFESYICAENSWLRLIKRTGAEWDIVCNKDTIRLLPLPPPPKSDPERPWKVLPYLYEIENNTLFVDRETPGISRNVDQWLVIELQKAISSVKADVISQTGSLGYLGQFIECIDRAYLLTEVLQKSLIEMMRRGLQKTSLDNLRENMKPISLIMKLIKLERKLAIGPLDPNATTSIPGEIFSSLWTCETDILLLPKDLDSKENPANANPPVEDALVWLKMVHERLQNQTISQTYQEKYLDVVRQILEAMKETDRSDLLRNNPDLTIISVTEANSLKPIPYSFTTIRDAKGRNNLFGYAQGTTQTQRAGWSVLLAKVLPEEQIILIRSDIFKMLFTYETLRTASDGIAILQALGVCLKNQGSEQSRQDLIEKVNDPDNNKEARRGLRYLLHGDGSHFFNDDETLWVAGHQQSPAWEKLWKQVAGILGQNSWNVLKRSLVQNIPPVRWSSLGISEITPSKVVEEMLRIGTGSIKPDEFSKVECEEILSFVEDKDLWRKLPLHIFLNNEKGAIWENVYLDIGKSLPTELSKAIRIVVNSDNPRVAEKQKRWINPLNEVAIITIALKSPTPGQHWQLIMDMLSTVQNTSLANLELLLATKWVPLSNGQYINPSNVIDIEFLSKRIQKLAAKAKYVFASTEDLNQELCNDPSYLKLKSSCFSSKTDGLLKLSFLMAMAEYYVGDIGNLEEKHLEKMLPVLAKVEAMPAWQIIEQAQKEFGLSSCMDSVLPQISKKVPTDDMVRALNEIACYAEQSMKGAEDSFLLYMKLYSVLDDARELLSEIRLKSKTGTWKSASELCFGATDISNDYLLEDEQAKILNALLVNTGQYNASINDEDIQIEEDVTLNASITLIKEYFNKWHLIQTELIGVLLCLLGKPYEELAELYQGPHSVKWFFNNIQWGIVEVFTEGNYFSNYEPQNIHNNLNVTIKVINADHVTVRNLIGQDIRVSLKKDFKTIVAGSPTWTKTYRCLLPIRDICPANYQENELSDFIKNTVDYLLESLYRRPLATLTTLWQELEKSDQLSIGIARNMILNHLPFYLRQLNAHRSKELRKALDEYDRALRNFEEYKFSPQNRDPGTDKKLSGEVDKKRETLAHIFANNKEAQDAVLHALRQKLKDYQYAIHSVPFELFQNADDAVVELADNDDVSEQGKKFAVDVDPKIVRFIHWGRMINSSPSYVTDELKSSYQRDLEKMLVLSSSDKPIDERMTGKFGLGFKSVFLCCNNPCIISGRMHIEIVGGVLPQPWKGDEVNVAVGRLEKFSNERRKNGTLTELKLDNGIDVQGLLGDFENLAGLLCVFGKAIRQIDIVKNEATRSFSWLPKQLADKKEIETGSFEILDMNGSKIETGMAIRMKDGTLFLAVSPRGFTCLPENIPSIWVTAPTREKENFGFAISSSFALDAGRSRLSGDVDTNMKRSRLLGREIGEILVGLKKDIEKSWSRIREDLQLKEDMTIDGLWASLWHTFSKAALSNDKTSAGEICRELALKVFEKLFHIKIPNGLPYPYEKLINADCASYSLKKHWCKTEVIECLKNFGISIEQCVASDIEKIVNATGRNQSISRIDFLFLFNKLGNGQCKETDSELLESIARNIWDKLPEKEREEASSKMAALKFKNKEGYFVESRNLIAAGIGDKEEDMRASFAPASAIISDSYNDFGKSFFKRCRPRYEAPTETLLNWVKNADTVEKKKSAMQYLVRGELGYKVSKQLRQYSLSGTWLSRITKDDNRLEGFNENEKLELFRLLDESYQPTIGFPPPVHHLDPKAALENIYSWWSQNKGQFVQDYERKTYPNGHPPHLSFTNLKNDYSLRKDWYVLFTLGALHTMGRSNPQQNRDFLKICLEKGWIDRFVQKSSDSSLEDWMKVLKEYLENQNQIILYYHWLKEFASMFLIAYWLDDYIISFSEIDRMRDNFILDDITCPRTYSAFGGGGPDAPPIKKALGMGACFIIREMTRKGIISNPHAFCYCYVPKGAVRNLLIKLGCDDLRFENDHGRRSQIIQKFLISHLKDEYATFDKSFDLPLLAVAEDTLLQRQLFQEIILSPEENSEEDPDANN